MSQPPEPATWSDFERVALRVGMIQKVEPFPEAREPAYNLWIDFGSLVSGNPARSSPLSIQRPTSLAAR